MTSPWYKHFWPWFIIGILGAVIIKTIIAVILFNNNQVSLVTEDYYKEGKAISIDLSKINVAKAFQLNAHVSSKENVILITLDKGKTPNFPALNVQLSHRTLEEKDIKTMLTSDASGNYKLTLDEMISGPWFLKLSPHNSEWLIQGKVNFPSSIPTQLM